MNVLRAAVKSWKTTVLACVAALVAIGNAAIALFDADPTTVPDWALVVGLIITAVGLLFAKDADVTGVSS